MQHELDQRAYLVPVEYALKEKVNSSGGQIMIQRLSRMD